MLKILGFWMCYAQDFEKFFEFGKDFSVVRFWGVFWHFSSNFSTQQKKRAKNALFALKLPFRAKIAWKRAKNAHFSSKSILKKEPICSILRNFFRHFQCKIHWKWPIFRIFYVSRPSSVGFTLRPEGFFPKNFPYVCVCALMCAPHVHTYAHAASCMRAFLTRTCVHTCARILNARLTRARKLNMRARAF